MAVAVFAMACSDAPTNTVAFTPTLHLIEVDAPEREAVVLCKAGPAGTYSFNATASHAILRDPVTGVHNLSAATYSIVVTAASTIDVGGTTVQGACYDFQGHNHIAEVGGGTNATVTVIETPIPAGVDFDHVVVYQRDNATTTVTSSTTNSATAGIGGVSSPGNLGASILFYNVAEPTGCTYTKGWYQNKNGAPTVIAVDGRSVSEAQQIFAATPGQPGNVTWGTNNKPNNLLNLYQQLLAALQNLGGDPLGGPPSVDAAIAAALAATGGTGTNITVTPGTAIGDLITPLAAFNEGNVAGFPHCTDEVLPI
jgi:hypothetical protein